MPARKRHALEEMIETAAEALRTRPHESRTPIMLLQALDLAALLQRRA
jgi:hypothetical protein